MNASTPGGATVRTALAEALSCSFDGTIALPDGTLICLHDGFVYLAVPSSTVDLVEVLVESGAANLGQLASLPRPLATGLGDLVVQRRDLDRNAIVGALAELARHVLPPRLADETTPTMHPGVHHPAGIDQWFRATADPSVPVEPAALSEATAQPNALAQLDATARPDAEAVTVGNYRIDAARLLRLRTSLATEARRLTQECDDRSVQPLVADGDESDQRRAAVRSLLRGMRRGASSPEPDLRAG